jgi:xylulose-5-phosphate/fructose-6-phosphate phosphoketolase
VIGDGEAETGPLAASWHSNKFLNPARDGAVLPILHLNGYKIANPTVLSRISEDELSALLYGYGYDPYFVEGDEPEQVHQALARTLDTMVLKIREIQHAARQPRATRRPSAAVAGAGTAHAQRLDRAEVRRWLSGRRHVARPSGALGRFPGAGASAATGRVAQELSSPGAVRCRWRLAARNRRAGPHRPPAHERQPPRQRRAVTARPGPAALRRLRRDLPTPGSRRAEATRVWGFLARRDEKRPRHRQLPPVRPDETASNRLDAVYEVTAKAWMDPLEADDVNLAMDGRVMEVLSEHMCEGWLEGYLLTGRHGLLSCYEAFIHIVDSMVNQHAKWLKTAAGCPGASRWRRSTCC